MPPENLPAVRKKQDPDSVVLRKLKQYLLLREDGKLFHEACKAVGVEPSTVEHWRTSNPQFRDAERTARRAGLEKVEKRLRDAAEEGEAWAIKDYLAAQVPETYGNRVQHEHSVNVNVSAANHLDKVRTLREELERRRRDTPLSVMNDNPYFRTAGETVDPDQIIVDAEIIDE